MQGVYPRASALERFEQFYTPEPNTGCWLWTGKLDNGYGRFWFQGKSVKAFRWAYEHILGQAIPSDLQLDHLCRQRACVNPLHGEPVTCRENLIRASVFEIAEQRRLPNGQYGGKRG